MRVGIRWVAGWVWSIILLLACHRPPEVIREQMYRVEVPRRCKLPGVPYPGAHIRVSGVATPTGIFVSVGDIVNLENQLEAIREWLRAAAPCLEDTVPVGRVVPVDGRMAPNPTPSQDRD